MTPESIANIKRKKRRYGENNEIFILDGLSKEMDKIMYIQLQITCIVGRLAAEPGSAVLFDDILAYLRKFIDDQKSWDDLEEILKNIKNLGLVKKESNGWLLTDRGKEIFKKESEKRNKLTRLIQKIEEDLESQTFESAAKLYLSKKQEKK